MMADFHIDFIVSENCQNLDSFGEICVKCNKCGRFDREKQIEEMAKANCAFCRSKHDCKMDACDCSYEEAEYLYNAGYRKQSDIATKIISDIESVIELHIDSFTKFCVSKKLSELKKKYEVNDETV